jgi:antitoxin PrlF
MAKQGQKRETSSCCSPVATGACCKVEALVSVDERGQMVLPKETREKVGIQAGDKLAVIRLENDGRTCCLALVKAEDLAGMVKTLLGPMIEEITAK